MLHKKLTHPESIVVVGGSNNLEAPGGSVLKNLLDNNFQGKITCVNPKEDVVQGVACFRNINDLPETDLAIIAIAAKYTLDTVRILAHKKNTRGFIIISAGFSEKDETGKLLEQELVAVISEVGGTLLGPNNIGLINNQFAGVFTTPVPKLCPNGVDLISGSGATAVFILEAAIETGLPFSSVYTVGNSAQTGVEDILEHMDLTFDPKISSKVKLLYLEHIDDPPKLLKHARSLIGKGCRIAAIKAGNSEAGSRAASSHTGALASSETAVEALFKKAGIIRCHGRNELINVGAVLWYPELKGKNIAIITHAGGPAVMLTDVLTKNGLFVPEIKSQKLPELLDQLFPGSSVKNPIDMLATADAEQLGTVIDYCEQEFTKINAIVVIFGNPGLFEVYDIYEVLHEKMKQCKKPIYPILPSVQNAKKEIAHFINLGNVNFSDEVNFGKALTLVNASNQTADGQTQIPKVFDVATIRTLIENADSGYLSTAETHKLLKLVQVPVIQELMCTTMNDCFEGVATLGYPVVMKTVGPLHKSDLGGVYLDLSNDEDLKNAYTKLMAIPDALGVLLQPMIKGIEVFAGVKKEGKFGHLIFCGLGGVYVEILRDIATRLAPIDQQESYSMIEDLRSYKILKGVRNRDGINIQQYASVLNNLSALVTLVPEIEELDLNPLLGTPNEVISVDARIRIKK
jgi:acetyltransferase